MVSLEQLSFLIMITVKYCLFYIQLNSAHNLCTLKCYIFQSISNTWPLHFILNTEHCFIKLLQQFLIKLLITSSYLKIIKFRLALKCR